MQCNRPLNDRFGLSIMPRQLTCHHGVIPDMIIIINPCKPYHFGIGTAPSGEVESRLIILSIFGVR
jgi:hypothetical protein